MDDHCVDAGPLELVHLFLGRHGEICDRELPGGHSGEQLEHRLEPLLGVLGRREEQRSRGRGSRGPARAPPRCAPRRRSRGRARARARAGCPRLVVVVLVGQPPGSGVGAPRGPFDRCRRATGSVARRLAKRDGSPATTSASARCASAARAASASSTAAIDGDAVALGDRVAEAAALAHERRFCSSLAHRVPDGLQLEEGRRSPTGSARRRGRARRASRCRPRGARAPARRRRRRRGRSR